MNRILLAVALVAACVSPALAGSGKVRGNHAYSAYPTPSWVLPLPHSQSLANALGGWNRRSLLGAMPLVPKELGAWSLRRQRLVAREA
jgi:hypothetical protein